MSFLGKSSIMDLNGTLFSSVGIFDGTFESSKGLSFFGDLLTLIVDIDLSPVIGVLLFTVVVLDALLGLSADFPGDVVLLLHDELVIGDVSLHKRCNKSCENSELHYN